ncbi:MAG TPA: NYN domain-containing protein [Candidatus Limnocylindrales bacterium]|nr:NYN domain-containing protein [Candidatus Limnocylindrales bacterium]
MSKNVAVFVDVANIFYAAKAAGVDIDYVTLLKASSAGRDLVRAYAYTGLDPDNENQRNFHDFLRRHGYKVVSKDIRKYGDGKVKANLDIELVVDMMKTARNLDIAIVVSGDGDFAPAIRAVQEQGVRVEVVSFRGNTSSDLMDVADQFTDITQIAKVEKGSSRSGRRVADDDADLSMTEVPDKQSEGTGDRGRGRGRPRRGAAPVASVGRGRSRSTAASRDRDEVAAAPRDTSDAPIVVLPGEKLSRAARPAALAGGTDAEAEDQFDGDVDDESSEAGLAGAARENGEVGEMGEDGPRRRRRRGGRGRGRGRGREGVEAENGQYATAANGRPSNDDDADADADAGDEEEVAPRTTRRSASTFGSVWDSQIGAPAAPSSRRPILEDEEDLEEPAIPEYLLTERRQRDNRGRGGAGRGRGGAYAAALERERFGGGRGSTPSRYAEPAPRREGGYGRSDRDRGGRMDRDRGGDRDRQAFRQAPRPAPRGTGDEPWSEVPPEIEAMLRAQMGTRASSQPRRPASAAGPAEAAPELTADSAAEAPADEAAPVRRTRTRRTTASAGAVAAPDGTADEVAEAPAKPARTRTRKAATDAAAEGTPETVAASGTTRTRSTRGTASTSRTTTRRTTAAASTATDDAAAAADAVSATDADTPAPKRRTTTRRKAEPAA